MRSRWRKRDLLVDDYARIFAVQLLALDGGTVPDESCAADEENGGSNAPMRDDLRLVAALRAYQVPHSERSAARENVRARLASAITLQATVVPGNTAGDELTHVGAARYWRSSGWRGRSRVAAAVAAVLAVSVLGGWQVSNAAAATYPGSPVYAVKRLEERIALATAWSDQRRGQVLATIADHRLYELTYEAGQHDLPMMRTLAGEYDSAMRSLIDLTATMQRDHEDISVLLSGLTHELSTESNALHAAQIAGNSSLSQMLTSSVESQRHAISAGHLDVMLPAPGKPQDHLVPPSGIAIPPSTRSGQGASQPSHQNSGTPGTGTNTGGHSGSGTSTSTNTGSGKGRHDTHESQSDHGDEGDRASLNNDSDSENMAHEQASSFKSTAPSAGAVTRDAASASSRTARHTTSQLPAPSPQRAASASQTHAATSKTAISASATSKQHARIAAEPGVPTRGASAHSSRQL